MVNAMQALSRIHSRILMSQNITKTTARAVCTKLTLQDVMHDEAKSEFFVQLDSDKAVLQYSLAQNEGVIDMLHTGVPPRFRGMGVAKLLAQTAFDYALQNRFKMKLSCWYLAEYLQKNPKREYEELVLK
ncbi:Protein NATD1 [Trichoplax sp. H2]|nr:Protein NATD1 [Trichoplax sp. H2]|eukprot:RDD37441.1 Protein NATD1 [Trichoplax sp. H2]